MKGLKIRKSEHQRSVTDELPGLSDRERQARLDERFGAGVAFAIADWGNAFWKQSLLDDVEAPARTVMANRITIIDDTQWEQIRRRAKFSQQRFANTQLLGVVERRSKDDKAKGDKTERHICPLQLDLISRLIHWKSNPGDVVFDPFGGIASTGFEALKLERKFVGSELKESYWKLGAKYLRDAETEANRMDLFQWVALQQQVQP